MNGYNSHRHAVKIGRMKPIPAATTVETVVALTELVENLYTWLLEHHPHGHAVRP